MAVSQIRAHPPLDTLVMIFAENVFSLTNPKIPNRLQKRLAGYMRRCLRVDLHRSQGGPGAECRVGKFRRVDKRRGGPFGHCRLGEFRAGGRCGSGGSSYSGSSCRVGRSLAYPVEAIQGRPHLTYPQCLYRVGWWLQKVTAHSSTVAPAVVVGIDLPCSAFMQGRSALLRGLQRARPL